MEIIVHRVNKSSNLHKIPKNYGVEIDVRDYKKKLILSHDPFKNGENLELFFKIVGHFHWGKTQCLPMPIKVLHSVSLRLRPRSRIRHRPRLHRPPLDGPSSYLSPLCPRGN